MAEPLTLLHQRATEDWLIGLDSQMFAERAIQRFSELAKYTTPPTILIAETDPLLFLSEFMAACAADCSVFLGNPNWSSAEWQQALELARPNLIVGNSPVGLDCQEPSPRLDRPCIMISTGGSSGQIRFAIHTWETLTASVAGFQDYFHVQSVNSCCVLPLYHVSGLMQFMRSFISGGKLAVLPFKSLESDRLPTIEPSDFFLSLVPTQLQRLLQQPKLCHWLSCFQTVLLGGAPAWAELLAHARQVCIRLAPTYGMTETASQIATLKPDDFLVGLESCGQVLPHAHLTIRDEGDRLLPPNQPGRISIEANSLALGYYPTLNTQPFFQPDDIGFLDEQGYLHIIGRQSRKIITGGENVFPDEVEAAIRATNLVADVGVLGLADQHWGEVVTAVYVPNDATVSVDGLRSSLTNRLSKYKHPKHYIAVASLPRNAQGKLNYEQLRAMAIQMHSARSSDR